MQNEIELKMTTMDTSNADYFASFNNAFDLNPDDHRMNLGELSENEDEYRQELMKEFSKASLSCCLDDPLSIYERDCYLMPYIYSNQPLATPSRSRSASAPIPMTSLPVAKPTRYHRNNDNNNCKHDTNLENSPKTSNTKKNILHCGVPPSCLDKRKTSNSSSLSSATCEELDSILELDEETGNWSAHARRPRASTLPSIPTSALNHIALHCTPSCLKKEHSSSDQDLTALINKNGEA